MAYSIIGTAGHVDHGKTRLIQALTGQDTDRLAEEKKRGITIELGFASLPLPDGRVAGIVDVPGHEKFIKNMLAGAGGMDLVLLVVAADEGFMPQTREHLGILTLLGVQQGLVVLTKTDRVDAEWLELVTTEVHRELQGSFLEAAPILPVSSVTGEGIPPLQEAIWQCLKQTAQRNTHTAFRMAVDRVFTQEGFGTVVTGTALSGTLREGDEVAVYPVGFTARVRTLQVHGQPVPAAYGGQRVAVNLAGVKRTDLKRGDFLAHKGSMTVTNQGDGVLRLLPGCGREVKRGDRLHFYHGTRDLLCRAYPLEGDIIQEGAEGLVQLRFEEPVALCPEDHYVVRFYSPLETIGGGKILDVAPPRHKRQDSTAVEGLRARLSGTPEQRLAEQVKSWQGIPPTLQELVAATDCPAEELVPLVEALETEGVVLPIAGRLVHTGVLQRWLDELTETLAAYHKREPLLAGMRVEELRGRLLPGKDAAFSQALLELWEQQGQLRLTENRVVLATFTVKLTPQQKRLREDLLTQYRTAGVEPPTTEELLAPYSKKEQEICRSLLEALQAEDELLVLGAQQLISRAAYEGAWQVFLEAAAAKGEPVTLAVLRDRLGSSRRHVLALLEQWDRRGMTHKVGEGRLPISSGVQ